MLDPITAFYALLGGVGLVGADAYVNSTTIHVETIVAPAYVEEGFEPRLVEALFLAELDGIIDADSMIPTPHMLSTNDKPMSSAVAEAVGLSHALEAAKSTVGVKHPVVILSVLSDHQDGQETRRIVVAGENSHGKTISISVPLNDRSLDDALEEAAFSTMKEIDPYVTALHAFEIAEAENRLPLEAEDLLKQALDDENKDLLNPRRARLENLMGLTQLLSNDPQEAKFWFDKSKASDSSFAVADLNLGFVAAVTNDCEQAISLAKPLVEPSYWVVPADGLLAYPANNLLGICSARLGNFVEANVYFANAADEWPDGTAVYYYWANSLTKEGKKDEADAMLQVARHNVSRMDNVPEIAMLHFWLTDVEDKKFHKRQRVVPRLEANLTE